MAYVRPNFPTKAKLKLAVKEYNEKLLAGQDPKPITVWSPGPFPVQTHGAISVEGPHSPKPHSWYARVEVRDGVVVKVIS